jgi:hypothetical protein
MVALALLAGMVSKHVAAKLKVTRISMVLFIDFRSFEL